MKKNKLQLTLVVALLPLGLLLFLVANHLSHRSTAPQTDRSDVPIAGNTSPGTQAADRNNRSKKSPPLGLVKTPEGAAGRRIAQRIPIRQASARIATPVADRRKAFLTGPAAGDPLDIALDYVRAEENRAEFTPEDFANPKVSSRYETRHNGVTHIYLRQQHRGIEVYNGDLSVNLMADGAIINLHNGFVSDLVGGINRTEPLLTAEQAIDSAAKHYRQPLTGPLTSLPVPEPDPAAKKQLFSEAGLSRDPIPAKLVYVAMADDSTRLAWNTVIRFDDGARWLDLNVDAETGDVLSEANWIAGASYHVFPQPVETPNHGSRSIETNPADLAASPFGWHDTDGVAGAEFTDTRGNNVNAQEDADDNDTGGVRPDGGAGLDFNFPLDLADPPSAYQEAVTSNLFYWNNVIHDIFWHYGFDEPSGNFQENNYGNGGAGSDPVEADSQDGSGTNNANFGTPPDGSNPRMQMFIWTDPTPDRDSSLDSGIIIHEYAHGISNRLTGGPANSSALNANQSGGMGEGWGDWLGLSLTAQPGDTATAGRGIGTYVLGQPTTGAGIRPFRYTTDMTANPQTFGDLAGGGLSVPHGVGSVWCTTLWEVYWALVGAHGFDADLYNGTGGNNIAIQLVIDGMKLQPASPTFLDARDAIIMADQINNAGANFDLLWAAFAKRGMGAGAYDGGDANSLAVVENFDIPDDLGISPGGADIFRPSGKPGGPFAPDSRTYTLSNDGDASLTWTVSKDATWLDLTASPGVLIPAASTTVDIDLNASADALTAGFYTATVTFINQTSGATLIRSVQLTISDLADAVDEPSLTFSTSADKWFQQFTTHHDGVDAAESADIDDNGTTWMETTVNGPDTISFYWKVDSESDYDFLRFLVDGVQEESISGNVDWTEIVYSLPAGSHVLRWEYTKDGSVSTGADSGWVDELFLDSLHPEPKITSELTASGPIDVPFSYQIVATKSPTSYSSGALPTGLSLNPISGLISGTPTVVGTFPVDITATNGAGSDTDTLTFFIHDLGNAVDNPGILLTTGGTAPWFLQSAVTHDGVDAAQSGDVDHNQESWMEITVTGPDTIAFDWKVDSDDGFDFLRLLDNGVLQQAITGDVDWTQVTYTVPAGSHTLRWEYSKDEIIDDGADAGWVDELYIASVNPEPRITSGLTANGPIDVAFSYQIGATNSPTSYSSGALPTGLSLNATSGLISGTPSVAGTFPVDITATNAAGSDTDTLTLTVHDLGNAVDNPGVLLTTGGMAPWFLQSAVTHDGVDAAQSGDVDDSQESWMEITVAGPDTIAFDWKVDSDDGFDFLRLLDNGVLQQAITGDVDWTEVSYTIPAGSHTLRWEYTKDGFGSSGADAGWVDELYIASVNPEPRITSTLTAVVPVNAPFSYQIVATNSPTSYSSGVLPVGLSLNATSGLISGTSSVEGVFPVDITATNAAGSHTATLNIKVFDLGNAVDSPAGLEFTTGGEALWFSQSTVTNDGVDAAQSGDIDDSEASWLETTVTGPDTVSFYWKVDSESGFDFLRFFDEGVEQHSIDGNVDWTEIVYSVPAGSHVLRWEYSKDSSVSTGADAGWLDELSLASAPQPPEITSNLNVIAPTGVPFSYQIVATRSPDSYSSDPLPTGLSLNTSSGLISGTPTAAGVFSVNITATNTGGSDTKTLILDINDLSNAVDRPTLQFTRGGEALWFLQTAVTHDGVDAASSGSIGDNESSWMETTLEGPDTISFFWKVDSQNDVDVLRLLDNGVIRQELSGDVNWTQVTYSVPAGSHVLRWQYSKNGSLASGADAAWVDELHVASLDPNPRIISDLTTSGGVNNPFSYQIVATNSPSSYASGALPPGLSLNPSTGLISGTPSAIGSFQIDITATNGAGADTTTLNLRIHELGNGVDFPALPITTGGAAQWFSQSVVTYNGLDAAQSGNIGDRQISWMETTVTGPDTLSFFWKVDSEINFDLLRFLDSGNLVQQISGNVDWTEVTYPVPAGDHVLRWEYVKNSSGSVGDDAGWVDQLALASSPQPLPEITSNLNITAPTDAPFSYQIVATEGPTSYSSDVLPAGLSLNTSTGLISGTPTTAGVYSISITVINQIGADTETLNITLIDTASFPFLETFEGGAFDQFWSVTGTGVARTQVTADNAAHDGSWHATMDTTSAADARNELTLAIDLTGQSFVALSFWAKDFGGDPDGPPASPFVGGADFDGVAISSDGNNWYEVQPLRTEIGAAYSKFVVDLDAAVAAHGLTYNSTFRIRFNHFDALTIPNGGFAFDDIAVDVFAPEIAVEDAAANDLEDGVSAISFASVDIGESGQHTFTIHNAGTEALTGLEATFGGAHAGEFSAPALASSTLAPGASTTLDVSFAPVATGLRTAALAITSNDADENPFDIDLGGTGVTPEIVVEVPLGTELTDGANTVDYGDQAVGTTAVRTVTIRNTGTSSLDGLATSIVGSGAAPYSASAPLVDSLAPGTSTTFDVSFAPDAVGVFAASLRIASDDLDENPFDIGLAGNALSPEIVVEIETVDVSDGSSVSFDDIVGSTPAFREVQGVIRNTGLVPLIGLQSSIDGPHAAQFTSTDLNNASVLPGESLPFSIRFSPVGNGDRSANLHIASNDLDESPFDIALSAARLELTTLGSFADEHGLTGDSRLASANDDGDDYTLLEEYAYNLDPNVKDGGIMQAGGDSGLPLIRVVNDRLQVEYLRLRSDPNLSYTVEYGSEIVEGPPNGFLPATEPETVSNVNSDYRRVIVRDSVGSATHSARFGRVKLAYPSLAPP